MKKFWVVLLTGAMLSGLSACGNDSPAPADFDEAALQTDAAAVADALLNGDYEAVTAKFDATMAEQLPAPVLAGGWKQTVDALGAYQERRSVEGSVEGEYYVVLVTESFAVSGLRVRVVYDGEGKVAGLQCTAVDLEENAMSEGCVEIPVTVAGDENYPLSGSLTLPKDVEKPAVVILLQGSGSTNKNESINGNKPFFDIAQGLAERGIASLRYDKRFYAYPEAAAALGADLDLRDEVLDDAAAAIELLQNDERVDSSRIYVLGHSLAGMLTPVMAADHPELAGVIAMAGSLRPLWEITYDQNQEAIAAINKAALSDADKATLEAQVQQVEADIATLRGDFSSLANDTMLMGIPVGYWKSLDELTGMKYIDQVTQPMLILQGEADFQVSPDKDFGLWQETLQDRDNVVFKLYPGLNHIMMPTQGKRDLSEYAVAGTVDAQVIDDIAAFIAE